jgi:hypothetical protein
MPYYLTVAISGLSRLSSLFIFDNGPIRHRIEWLPELCVRRTKPRRPLWARKVPARGKPEGLEESRAQFHSIVRTPFSTVCNKDLV